MSHHTHTSVGGSYWTRGTTILFLVGLVGLALIVWRFFVGLGAATGLSDGYPWGIWIAFDVVTGTALACGGYAVALLVYIFNRGKYHPLVRPALLVAALGYSVAAIGIIITLASQGLVPLQAGIALMLGANVGTYGIETRVEVGLFAFQETNWHLGAAPELGILMPMGESELYIYGRYNYAVETEDRIETWATINIGIAHVERLF